MTGTIEENKKKAREAALSMGFDLPKRCEVLLPGQHEGKTPLERWLSEEPRFTDNGVLQVQEGWLHSKLGSSIAGLRLG